MPVYFPILLSHIPSRAMADHDDDILGRISGNLQRARGISEKIQFKNDYAQFKKQMLAVINSGAFKEIKM